MQSWAERIYRLDGREHLPEFPESDPRSVVGEVMGLLNFMYSIHVLRRDVPVLRQFLLVAQDDSARAWVYYHEASKDIDSAKRWNVPFE